MYELPTSITIEDKQYGIRKAGDFRVILDCFTALQDIELPKEERLITALEIFYGDVLYLDRESGITNLFELFGTPERFEAAVKGMYLFFSCNQESTGNTVNYKLLDWDKDSQMIASAVNKVAGFEVRSAEYIHWWTFLGYYGAVGKSTLSTVIGIRQKMVTGKKLEKYEKEFVMQSPQFFDWDSSTVEQKEAQALGDAIWNQE